MNWTKIYSEKIGEDTFSILTKDGNAVFALEKGEHTFLFPHFEEFFEIYERDENNTLFTKGSIDDHDLLDKVNEGDIIGSLPTDGKWKEIYYVETGNPGFAGCTHCIMSNGNKFFFGGIDLVDRDAFFFKSMSDWHNSTEDDRKEIIRTSLDNFDKMTSEDIDKAYLASLSWQEILQEKIDSSVDFIETADGEKLDISEPVIMTSSDFDPAILPDNLHCIKAHFCEQSELTDDENVMLNRRNSYYDRHESTQVAMYILDNSLENPDFFIISESDIEEKLAEQTKVVIRECFEPCEFFQKLKKLTEKANPSIQ